MAPAPDDRMPTAFELFLQKRQAETESHGEPAASKRLPVTSYRHGHNQRAHPPEAAAPSDPPPPPRPLALDSLHASYSRPYGITPDRPTSQHGLRRSAPELSPQVIASLRTPRVHGGAAPGASSPPAVYNELASAAQSLASAAHKLARGTAADRTVAASYETLAQAAADLAASACMIRPLTGSASVSRPGPPAGAGGSGKAAAGTAAPPARPSEQRSNPSALPRAVDPMAAAAAAAAMDGGGAGVAAAAAPPGPPIRPGTGASAAGSGHSGRVRVAAPRFPGYNPLIHLVESELPMPGETAGPRPPKSSPITHQLHESRYLPSSGGTSTAGSAQSRSRRRSSLGPQQPHPGAMAAGGHNGATDGGGLPMLHPSELSRLPVLSLGPDGSTWRSHSADAGAAGGGGGAAEVLLLDVAGGGGKGSSGARGGQKRQSAADATSAGAQEVDPLTFLSPYADLRLSEWPPREPITVGDMQQEELDARYNKLLAALRDKVQARGAGRLTAAFRDIDRAGLGRVSRLDFLAVLQGLNLGGPGLVDEKVVDMMLDSIHGSGGGATAATNVTGNGGSGGSAGSGGGRSTNQQQQQLQQRDVAYGDFVNALRFGSLPWRGYNRKLRHRLGADPDQPIGPTSLAAGLPPYGIINGDATGTSSPGAAALHLHPVPVPAPATPSPPRLPAAPSPLRAAIDAAAAMPAAGASPSGRGCPIPPMVSCSLATKWADLREAFQVADRNRDGVVEWGEFREAMQRMGGLHRLQLTDAEVLQVYQEANPDLHRGVNYEAFMAMYGGGAPATPAANAFKPPKVVPDGGVVQPTVAVGPLIPEFFQPKVLRCSHLSRPWPWSWDSAWKASSGEGGQERQRQQRGRSDGDGSGGDPRGEQLWLQQPQQQQRVLPAVMQSVDAGGAAAVAGVGKAGHLGGVGVSWGAGVSRTEGLRGAHAGAAAVLKRLGSAGGGAGRAPVWA